MKVIEMEYIRTSLIIAQKQVGTFAQKWAKVLPLDSPRECSILSKSVYPILCPLKENRNNRSVLEIPLLPRRSFIRRGDIAVVISNIAQEHGAEQ